THQDRMRGFRSIPAAVVVARVDDKIGLVLFDLAERPDDRLVFRLAKVPVGVEGDFHWNSRLNSCQSVGLSDAPFSRVLTTLPDSLRIWISSIPSSNSGSCHEAFWLLTI